MTVHEARARRRYALERELAPHVEETWAEAFILELRLRGVSGPRIADALVEVDSHCAESGTSASEAFGDAVEYAVSLGLPSSDEPVGRRLRGMVPMAVQVLGMLVASWSVVDARQAAAVDITVGAVVVALLLVGQCALLAWRDEQVLRLVVEHPVRAWFAMMASTTASVLLLLGLDGVLVQVGARAVLAAGLVLLVGGAAWETRRQRSGATPEDLLVAPLATEPAQRPSGWRALALQAQPWLLPVLAVGLVAVVWALG